MKPRSPLPAIVLVLLAGVLAGAQLGKIAPLVGWYQAELGLSLVTVGWLTAILGIFIAFAAMPAGVLIDRIGLTATVRYGAALMVLGGLVFAFAADARLLFAARLVEAVGYLAMCVGLPAVLNHVSPPSWKGPVLAIWSGFVPFGFALCDLLAASMLPGWPAQAFLAAITLAFALCAVGALLFLPRMPGEPGAAQAATFRASLAMPVVLAAVGFGLFVAMSVVAFAFMANFIAGPGAHFLLAAGVIALIVPLGNVATGVVVGGRGARFMAGLTLAAFGTSALAAIPAFTSPDPVLATGSAVIMVVSGAVVASALFAMIPYIVPRAGSSAMVIGLICQAGGIATLLAPPAAAAVIERFGYAGLSGFIAAAGLAGIAVTAPLLRMRYRPVPAG